MAQAVEHHRAQIVLANQTVELGCNLAFLVGTTILLGDYQIEVLVLAAQILLEALLSLLVYSFSRLDKAQMGVCMERLEEVYRESEA